MTCYCIFCGSNKSQYRDACPSCKKAPANEYDVAKSMLMSFEYNWESAGLPYGEDDIKEKAKALKQGHDVIFKPEDVEEALAFSRSDNSAAGNIYASIWVVGFIAVVILSLLYIFDIVSF